MKKAIVISKECKKCGNTFSVPEYRGKAVYCSAGCYSAALIGTKRCPCPPEVKLKISLANKGVKNGMYGKEAWNSGLKGIHLSPKSEFKRGEGWFKECSDCGSKMWVGINLINRKKFCSKKCLESSRKKNAKPKATPLYPNHDYWKGKKEQGYLVIHFLRA